MGPEEIAAGDRTPEAQAFAFNLIVGYKFKVAARKPRYCPEIIRKPIKVVAQYLCAHDQGSSRKGMLIPILSGAFFLTPLFYGTLAPYVAVSTRYIRYAAMAGIYAARGIKSKVRV